MATLLETLHDEYMELLPTTQHLNYLLGSSELLRNNNLDGWLKKFKPSMIEPLPLPSSPKRRRGCQDIIFWIPQPKCEECKGETIEDVMEGCVVCIQCGLIQDSHVLVPDVHTNTSGITEWHTTKHVVHRYSRLVYFRSLLAGLQGETTPTISTEIVKIRETCQQFLRMRNNQQICVLDVKNAIKLLKLPYRHVRHAVNITSTVSGKESVLLDLTGAQQRKFLRLFRACESIWDSKKEFKKERTYFINYTFLILKFCVFFGVDGSRITVIKNVKARKVQESLFSSLIKSVDLKRFL